MYKYVLIVVLFYKYNDKYNLETDESRINARQLLYLNNCLKLLSKSCQKYLKNIFIIKVNTI